MSSKSQQVFFEDIIIVPVECLGKRKDTQKIPVEMEECHCYQTKGIDHSFQSLQQELGEVVCQVIQTGDVWVP